MRRQQQLGRMAAMGPQHAVVNFHQMALPHSGHGLQLGQSGGTLRQSQASQARADRAGSDQHGFAAGGHELVQFFGQRGHALLIELPIGAGEHARADLDDDRVRRGGNFLSHEVGHGEGRRL